MIRPLVIRCINHPYYITAQCKEKFPLPLHEVWRILLIHLEKAHIRYRLIVHAFVLRDDHFHLLCHTPDGNIDEIMHFFMRGTSVTIARKSSEHAFRWHGRYRWSVIASRPHYFQVYRYILQDPLSEDRPMEVEDHPFSFHVLDVEAEWLNERLEQAFKDLIRLGLRKGQFDVNGKKRRAFSRLSLPVIFLRR